MTDNDKDHEVIASNGNMAISLMRKYCDYSKDKTSYEDYCAQVKRGSNKGKEPSSLHEIAPEIDIVNVDGGHVANSLKLYLTRHDQASKSSSDIVTDEWMPFSRKIWEILRREFPEIQFVTSEYNLSCWMVEVGKNGHLRYCKGIADAVVKNHELYCILQFELMDSISEYYDRGILFTRHFIRAVLLSRMLQAKQDLDYLPGVFIIPIQLDRPLIYPCFWDNIPDALIQRLAEFEWYKDRPHPRCNVVRLDPTLFSPEAVNLYQQKRLVNLSKVKLHDVFKESATLGHLESVFGLWPTKLREYEAPTPLIRKKKGRDIGNSETVVKRLKLSDVAQNEGNFEDSLEEMEENTSGNRDSWLSIEDDPEHTVIFNVEDDHPESDRAPQNGHRTMSSDTDIPYADNAEDYSPEPTPIETKDLDQTSDSGNNQAKAVAVVAGAVAAINQGGEGDPVEAAHDDKTDKLKNSPKMEKTTVSELQQGSEPTKIVPIPVIMQGPYSSDKKAESSAETTVSKPGSETKAAAVPLNVDNSGASPNQSPADKETDEAALIKSLVMSRYKEGRYSIARRNQRYKKYFLMGKDPPPENTSDSEGESPGSHQMSPDYSYKRSPDTTFKRVDNVNDAIEVLMAPTKKPEPAFEDKYPYFYPLKPPPLPKEEHESVIASQPLPQQTDIERKETDSTEEKVRSRSSTSSSTSSSSSAGSASPSSASTHSSDAREKESSGTEEVESISDKDEGMQGDEIVATKMTVEQPEEMSEFKEKETQEEVAVTGEDQKQPEDDETVVVLEHEEPSDSGVKPVAAVAAAIPLISKTSDKDKEDKVSSSAPYESTPAEEGRGQETMETHSEHEECIPDETHSELTFTVATSYPSESTQAAQEPEIVVITSDPERERRDSVSSCSSSSSSSSSSTSTSDRQESPVKVPPQKPSIPPPLPPKQQEKGDVTAGHLESSSPPHSPPPPPPQFADGDKPITDDSIQMAEQSHIPPEDIEAIVQEDVTVKISPPHSPPPPPPVSPPVSPTDEGPSNDSISEQSTLGESPQPPLPDMPPPSKLLLLVQDRSEDGHATCEYIPVSPTPESPPSPTKEETPNKELSIPPLSTSPPDITPETPVIETHDKPDAHAIPGQKKELNITEEPATNIVDTTNYFAVECEGEKGEGEDKSPDIEEDADMVQAIMKSVALSYQSKQEPITQSGDDSTLGDQTIEEEEPLQDSSAEFEDSNISVSNIDTMPSSTPLAVTAAAKSLQQGDQEVEQSVPDVIGSINETQRESQEIEPPADAPLEVNVTISSQDDETIHADDSELKEDTSMGVTPESIMIYSIDDESEANESKQTVAPASPDIITQEKDATPEISESKAAEKETISPEKVDTAEKKVKSEEISEIQPADKGNVNIEKKKVAAVAVASKPKDTRQTPPARPVQKAPTSPKEGDPKAKQKKGKKLGIFNFLIESPSKHKAEKMAKKREKEAAKQSKKTEKEVEKVTKKPEKEPEHRVSAKSTKSEKAKKPVKSEKPEKSAKPMKVYGKKGKEPQYQSTGMAVDAEPPPLSKKSKKPPKEAVVAGAVVAKRGKGNRETEHRKSIEAQMHGYDEPRAVKASTLEREEKKHAKHDAETPGPETEKGEQQKEDFYTSKQKDKAKRESDYDRKKDHKSTGKRATLMKLPESEAGKAEQIEKSEAKTVMRKASKDQLLGDEPQQTKANYAKTPGQENVSVSKTAAMDSQSVPVGSENVAKDPSEEQYPQQGHSPKQEKPEPVYATINEEHKKSQQSLLDNDKSQAENERQSPPPPSPPTPPPKNFTSSDELQDTSLPLPSPPPHGVFQYEEQERPPQDPDTPKEKEPTQEPSSTASAEKQKPLHQPHTYDTPSDAKQAVHDDSYMIPRNQGQSKPEPTYTNTASSQTAPEHIPSQAAVSHQVVEKVPVYHQQQEEEAPLYSYSSKKAQSLPDIQQDEPKTQGTQTYNNQHRPDQHDAYDRPRAAQEPAGQQNNNKKQDELSPIIEGHQSTGKHNVGSMTDDNLSENSFLSESNRDRELPSPGYFDDDDESLYSSQSQASRYDRRYKSFSDDRDLTRRGRLQKGYSEPTVSRSESGDSDPDVIKRRQKRTQRRRAQEKPVRHSYAFEDDDRQRRQSEKQSKTFMLNRSRLESKTRSQQDIDIEPIKVKKLELKNTSL